MRDFCIYNIEDEHFHRLSCDSVLIKEFETKAEFDNYLLFHPYCTYIVSEIEPYKVHFAQYELPYWDGYKVTKKKSFTTSPYEKNFENEHGLVSMKNLLIQQKQDIESRLQGIYEVEQKIQSE